MQLKNRLEWNWKNKTRSAWERKKASDFV